VVPGTLVPLVTAVVPHRVRRSSALRVRRAVGKGDRVFARMRSRSEDLLGKG